MDMRRITEQERATFPKVLRNTVMDVIGREPVCFFNIDLEVVDDPPADILELEAVRVLSPFASDRSDERARPFAASGNTARKSASSRSTWSSPSIAGPAASTSAT